MADIIEILKDVGVEMPEDKKDDFNREFRKSYKSEGELRKIRDDLKKANDTIGELQENAGKYDELKTKYDTETTGYQKQLADINFNKLLDGELKGVEFISNRVKDSIISEIRGKDFKEKDGKLDGLNDYLKELYEKEPDTFKSVDGELHTWGKSDNSENDTGKNTGVLDNGPIFL